MGKSNNPRKLILNKLAAYGFDTEKKVQSLTTDDLLQLAQALNLKVPDIQVIRDFQKAIKEKRTWAFYNNGIDKEVSSHDRTEESGERDHRDGEFRGTEGIHRDNDGQHFGEYRTEAGAFQ